MEREHEAVIAAASEAGAGIVIRGGAAKGAPSEGKQRGLQWERWQRAKLEDLLGDMTPMEFILRFTFSNPDLDTTIVGTANPAHLQRQCRDPAERAAAGGNLCRSQAPPCRCRLRASGRVIGLPTMSGINTRPTTKDEIKVERPRLHKVILVNDDYTPREFVVTVLKAEFRISEDQAMRVMITAHQARCVRRRRLHEGCSGSQGDERDGCGPQQGLSIAVHDRARGIG